MGQVAPIDSSPSDPVSKRCRSYAWILWSLDLGLEKCQQHHWTMPNTAYRNRVTKMVIRARGGGFGEV